MGSNIYNPGGDHGLYCSQWLENVIGVYGLMAVLLLTAIAFLTYLSKETISVVRKVLNPIGTLRRKVTFGVTNDLDKDDKESDVIPTLDDPTTFDDPESQVVVFDDNGTSEGKPVANQEVFKKIIHLVNYYDLDINFYHIRGHVERVGYNKAMKGFRASNGFQISLDVIRSICKMNTLVDNYSRNTLKEANLANYEALPTFYSYGFPEENRREYMRQFRRHINLRGE